MENKYITKKYVFNNPGYYIYLKINRLNLIVLHKSKERKKWEENKVLHQKPFLYTNIVVRFLQKNTRGKSFLYKLKIS